MTIERVSVEFRPDQHLLDVSEVRATSLQRVVLPHMDVGVVD